MPACRPASAISVPLPRWPSTWPTSHCVDPDCRARSPTSNPLTRPPFLPRQSHPPEYPQHRRRYLMADFSVDSNVHGGPIGPVTGSVLADVTSELTGVDNMKLTLAGGTQTTLAGENTVHSDATLTLAPVTTTSTIDLKPVTTTGSVETTSSVDLKPVAVDSCVR